MKNFTKLGIVLLSLVLVVACAKEDVTVNKGKVKGETIMVTAMGAANEVADGVVTRAEETPIIYFTLGDLFVHVPVNGDFQSIRIHPKSDGQAPGGTSEAFLFGVTPYEDGSMLVFSGEDETYNEITVPAGAEIYFSNIAAEQVEMAEAEGLSTPNGDPVYAAPGEKLYKSAQTTLTVNDNNELVWFNRVYNEVEETIHFYRMTGEFKANVFFYTMAWSETLAKDVPVTLSGGAFETLVGSVHTAWTVTPYVREYPYIFRLQNNDGAYNTITGVPVGDWKGVYQLASAAMNLGSHDFKVDNAGEIAEFNNTVASVMETGPYLFTCNYANRAVLSYYIQGPDGERFIADVLLDDGMNPNDAKTYNVAINISGLLNANNGVITRGADGIVRIPAELW